MHLLAQTMDTATGGGILAAVIGCTTLIIGAVRDELKDRRLHKRKMRRLDAYDECRRCVEPRDEWIERAIDKHPDLGLPALPVFPDCERPKNDPDDDE